MITDHGVAEKIVSVRQKFEKTTAELRENMMWEQSDSRRGILRKRAEKVSEDLRFFNAVIENLPPCLELKLQTHLNILDKEHFRSRRRIFKNHEKEFFIKAAAHQPANLANLLEMGLTEAHVRHMQDTGTAPYTDAARNTVFGVAVTQIESMEFGGSGKPWNLRLVPEHIARLRKDFVEAQSFLFDGKPGSILTLVPAVDGDKIPVVPLFPNGFLKIRVNPTGTEHKAPVNALFGVPVYEAA